MKEFAQILTKGLSDVDIGGAFDLNFLSRRDPTSIGSFVSSLLSQVYTWSLLIMFIYFIWGSYRYLISAGDAKAVAGAKAHLTWAIIGMVIIFLAYWMYQIVNALLFNAYQPI